MWWRSEVNCSFFLCLAAFRTRPNAWVTRARLCVRCVLCWSAFPLVPGLGSANSAAGRPALFIGFIANMPESDFSGSCISDFGSSPSRYGPSGHKRPMADPEISRFPRKERPYMPGSKTTPGLAGARNDAPASVAFRGVNNVGTRVYNAFAAQWLAYTLPYRRFAVILAEDCARIGGDVGCYSFIAVDSHHILLCRSPGALTRVAACTLALSPIRDTLIEGFSHFVTSMTAPIASGWSESPGGACTHWKAPPCHGAPPFLPFLATPSDGRIRAGHV